MPRFPETNEPTPETKTPERPPVYNECNCHRTGLCICNCGEQRDGNGDEDGASMSSPTLVPSNSSETDDEDHHLRLSDSEEDAGEAASINVQLPLRSGLARDIHAFLAGFRGAVNDFVLDPDVVVDYGHATYRPFSRNRNIDAGSPNSMRNEHGSDDPRSSSRSSSRRSNPRTLSPGPGMLAWADEALGIQLQLQEYLFTDSPLRLTPQRRYCRGLVASHLIVRDG